MRQIPFTLTAYIARSFLLNLLLVLSTFTLLILVIDTLEMFRRSVNKDVPFLAVIQMVILKYPLMAQRFIPFVMLIAGVLTYSKLTRHSELVVCRAAGVSAWQFLMPSLLVAFAFGVFMLSVFNPLACAMAFRYERVESKYLYGRSNYFAVSDSGLWLRQKNYGNYEDNPGGETILHAKDAGGTEQEIALTDVIIFVFEAQDKLHMRIDAASATLLEQFWQLKDVTITDTSGFKRKHQEYFLETEFTPGDIQNSFASPETISFWELPSFIHTLEKSGFSALTHRMHWQRILASPFFYMAMVIIASLFSLRLPRRGKTGMLLAMSIMAGFFIYFATNLISSLGLSGTIPVVLAAWVPVGICTLVGISVLLHIEDG